ncbi:hypothetical protein GCM10009626_20420 [Brachybacterium sacelli]
MLVVGGGLTYLALTRGGDEDPTASGSPSTGPSDAESPTASGSEGTDFEVISPIDTPPGDAEDLWAIMADNPLTEGTLPDVTSCELPATPATKQTPEEVQAVLTSAGDCLNQVWAGASSDRALPWDKPSVQVYSWPDIPESAGCEKDTFEKDYPRVCNLDGTIYWPVGYGSGASRSDDAAVPGAYLWDLSFLYMTTVSWNSSLGAYYEALNDQLTGDERNAEALRRYRLQFRCIAAASAMQQPSAAQPAPAMREGLLTESTWSETEEFDPASLVLWLRAGMESGGDLSACNTWNAPADQVA